MTCGEAMERLRALGDEKIRVQNEKRGAGTGGFGVMMGDLRTLAKEIKADPGLARELWATGNPDARQLAILLMKPKETSLAELEAMERDISYSWLADWLNSYVLKLHPQRESVREAWMASDHPMVRRAGWSLTADRVGKEVTGLDLSALLDRIESEMPDAPEAAQWTMNMTLAYVGIHHPELRHRALEMGERLGVYRDYPVSKGCTSPFAPIWINAMVDRAKG